LGGYEDAYERNGRRVAELARREDSVGASEFEFGNPKSEFRLSNALQNVSYMPATIRKNRYFPRLNWI
jgi:hypothetical protein